MLDRVLGALQTIRAPQVTDEYDLHALTAAALQDAGIEFEHEARLAPRCRIDFLAEGIGIELKRGRPEASAVLRQLTRYAQSERVEALVLVTERGCPMPVTVASKRLAVVSLQRLWGLALDGSAGAEENTPVAPTISFRETDEAENAADLPAQGALTGGEEAAEEAMPDPMAAYMSAEALQAVPLPPYLEDSKAAPTHFYGTLSYNKRSRCWMVRGEAPMTELLKRLWPGASGGRRGEVRVPASRRAAADLGWVMLRYPLVISVQDERRWQEAKERAREDYRRREMARVAPPAADPPASAFSGTLKVFQRKGLSFLLMTPRALLADEMGLGKTVQALAALASLKAFPALLIVPPHLVRNWQTETARFLRDSGREPRVHVLRGLTPYPLPEADLYIVHYLLLRGWKQELPRYPFRAVVFDEIQELRRTGSEKYSAASLIAEKCDRVYGLSGTPIYNQGGEIWNVVNILDYHFLGDFDSFSREWCLGYGNHIVRHPEELGEYLRREGLMLRRTKQEVLPELPDKRRLVQEIDADDALYRKLMEPVFDKLRRWQFDRDLTRSERALLEDQISLGQRQATGLAKAPFVCQFVRALVEAGESVLLFAHHHAVMDHYRRELKTLRPVFITGRESAAQKQDAVDRFMAGKTDLCCISLRAASGLNLQRATCVVFGELDWSPAVHSQAEDRAHRIGHADSLLCYYLVSPEGSDPEVQEALGLKVSQFEGLMGDRPLSEAQRAEDASFARRHVEKLAERMTSS